MYKNMTAVYTLLISLSAANLVLGSLTVPAAVRDLDSCGTCSVTATGNNSIIPIFQVLQVRSPCRCDIDCAVYGDCCPDYSEPAAILNSTIIGTGAEDREFQCRSTFLGACSVTRTTGVHYWTVSECSPNWLSVSTEFENQQIERNCLLGAAPNTNLPPVLDTNTGIVYANEYCAICNGIENILPWSYTFQCSGNLSILAQDPNFTLTQELISAECQPCNFAKPVTSSQQPTLPVPLRTCDPHIGTCLSKEDLEARTGNLLGLETYEEIRKNCTHGPYSLVQAQISGTLSVPYRNQYCAICNGVDINHTELECYTLTVSILSNIFVSVFEGPPPFSLVLDIHGNGIIVAHSGVISTTVPVTCSSGEVFDPVSDQCRPSVCPQGYATNGGNCSFTFENGSLIQVANCSGGFLPLNSSDYEDLGNGTIRLGDEILNFTYTDEDGRPLICLSQNGTIEVNVTVLHFAYPDGYIYITYIGCSLSIVGCVLILLTYGLFKELRTLPGKVLMNLAAAIAVANFFIIVGGPVTPITQLCTAVAIILHTFFLAQFSWMSIMSFEMLRTFRRASQLMSDLSIRSKTRLFTAYFIFGWSVPLIIAAVSVIVNFTSEGLILYGVLEDGTQGSCWINQLESTVVAFIVPVAASLVFNGVVFVYMTYLLCRARHNEKALHTANRVPYLRILLAIFTTTGLTWIFGFLALLVGTSWAWYPFIVLNSTQGFTMSVAFLSTKKVGKVCLACCKKQQVGLPSSKPTVDVVDI